MTEMDVRNILKRNILKKIPTFILVLIVCLGITSHCVRAIAVFAETETEKIDPQEEKKLCQRFNLSKISRQIHIKHIIPFLEITIEEPQDVEYPDYQKPAVYQRNHRIPILRAPPSTSLSA
jgi:hypothetical protein